MFGKIQYNTEIASGAIQPDQNTTRMDQTQQEWIN